MQRVEPLSTPEELYGRACKASLPKLGEAVIALALQASLELFPHPFTSPP